MPAVPTNSPVDPRRKEPLIPEAYLDVPTQRLYCLSLGAFIQAVKLFDFFRYIASSDESQSLCVKWLAIDIASCLFLSQLRIPRLNYATSVVALQIVALCFFDGLMFGGVSLNLARAGGESSISPEGYSGRGDLPSAPQAWSYLDYLSPFFFGALSSSYGASGDSHLLGQHTVRMSPISTANLNPNGLTFCLSSPGDVALVPVLLNNTNPSSLRYSLTPLGQPRENGAEYFDLSSKELKAIEQAHLDALQVVKPSTLSINDDEYDEYDDEEEEDSNDYNDEQSSLQKTQSLVHIRLTKPGNVRLERILDASGIESRLVYPAEVVVVPCPRVAFVGDSNLDIRCAGGDPDHQLMIDISGVTPLSLRWFKMINGKQESFLVEGIESNHDAELKGTGMEVTRRQLIPSQLQVPLSVSSDTVGTHLYVLEEVMDAVGNTVRVGSDSPSSTSGQGESFSTTTTRSFQVLRRPAVSFKHCSPGNPTPLLIGSEASLTISANEADSFDLPLEVTVEYQPSHGSDSGSLDVKRFKSWRKTLSTQDNRMDLNIQAGAPGEYAIEKVKGKWCKGDVLAPETCQVVERPFPSAEIDWKKIHECSGDTGVSAALVLHGTPPFHVYYRIQQDSQPPRNITKTFATSRGELTIQPERSGHYVFSFTHISDAYYRKVELDGPSIDQIIHPPASADFSGGERSAPRSKRQMSSCEGGSVDVDVELRGSGPWNLEVQVVGPKSSDTLLIKNIETSKKTLQIPVPKQVDRTGGTFEIDLVSVEDKYKCKRPISVPGISVNVRRIKSTVKFYGERDKRHVTVLEKEKARLPLRLTGDGPWKMKYRRLEAPQQVLTATLTIPNDFLHVTDKGTYEILEISDSQCPGSIVADGLTYRVDWIPKPSAKLSQTTAATYEPYNGSYILPPICEGMTNHVELDLSAGRPPFEIMYNIAQNSETGGTKLIDQPTFNSIQPHTRLQLQTSNPGRVYYEVKQIGDSSYPLAKHRNAVIPPSERLLFEQHVSMRPSAQFKNRHRVPYCLNDPFTPLDHLSSDGMVLFQGTPPFKLRMSIKNVAASHVDAKTIETYSSAWKIDLPSYHFLSIGAHLVTIDSVSDASSCDHAALDPLASSIWVDVAETAAVVPFDKREDYCVGYLAQFQLEGIPPWTIGYRINGRAYTQEATTSPFSLSQQQAGEFTITSISHQQKMCKAVVTDLRFTIHPLPSAQVGHGKRIYQDIHEGDQAEIVFTLIGEPPFTFTYQRSEPVTKKGGKPGKVLETHTVSRVYSKEYSIFSALEGTWTVSSISDRYCRYPASQPDAGTEKQKR
ncbi:uncharacterized protein BT62DRAFT_881882 [Guyanagaster necrorhizus]|uniref:Nucleoporin Pom152 n=1 Tax=Guyanagaster necrorhizus TaxID=856835 RepID=A0A9P7W526_9AGAR|nr:uncharacterized protein BT62DRAFT_881882 [Guyanagaster necrorhizus MCA 3950]KAG7452288.1 hypothetical protein BT62DRAFT_881882 [Guyanagaster necrorhizus MCA 3950]